MPEAAESATGINPKSLTRKSGLAARVILYHSTMFRAQAVRQAHRGAVVADRLIKSADGETLPGLARALDLFTRLEADLLQQPMGSRAPKSAGGTFRPGVIELGQVTTDGPEAQPEPQAFPPEPAV